MKNIIYTLIFLGFLFSCTKGPGGIYEPTNTEPNLDSLGIVIDSLGNYIDSLGNVVIFDENGNIFSLGITVDSLGNYIDSVGNIVVLDSLGKSYCYCTKFIGFSRILYSGR